VRDRKVALVDAIAYSDYLRDCVAADGAKPLTRSLSPYDVVNVQDAARFLLLASLGFKFGHREGRRVSGPDPDCHCWLPVRRMAGAILEPATS
jgi:hypothetical protein